MFLPLLNASKKNNGAAMIGKLVYVYTSKSMRYTYKITKVRRHVSDISSSLKITDERLWLQTSEGPNHTYPKLIIVAQRSRRPPCPTTRPTPRRTRSAADGSGQAAQRIGSGPGSRPSSRNCSRASASSSTARRSAAASGRIGSRVIDRSPG